MIVRHQRESASNRGFRQLARYIRGRETEPRATWFLSANLPGVSGRDDLGSPASSSTRSRPRTPALGASARITSSSHFTPTIGDSSERSFSRLWKGSWILWGSPSTSTSPCATRYRSRAHPRRDQQDPSRDLSDSLARLGPPEAIHRGPGPRAGARPDTPSVEDARPREGPAASCRLRSPPWNRQLRALGPGKASACSAHNRVTKLG